MTLPAGTPVEVCGYSPDAYATWEPARVARTLPHMLPMPEGYVPVRFLDDGAALIVHESRVRRSEG